MVWRLDPVSGASWPGAERSAFDIDFRFEDGHGDVKYVAEANRLHFLVAPAIHAHRARDASLASSILRSVYSWMEANPRGVGSIGIQASKLAQVGIAVVHRFRA